MSAATVTPEAKYLALVASAVDSAERSALTTEGLTALFDELKPITSAESDFLLGDWSGGDFDTGHPASQTAKDIKWAGKAFRSTEDVEPLLVYTDDGKRVPLEPYGQARVRSVMFRGVLSAAMVYDIRPIIDHFRYVDENTVAGLMDIKDAPEGYHFYLTRLSTGTV
ncbi:hypothetical protein C8F01DRAFT_516206 [Mycena amicta]|nr:hypothetical protein C8F01DRAFT_516206 [Mycena amicta]